MKFIAKKDTWFDEGTEAKLLGEMWECFNDPECTIPNKSGIFVGFRGGKLDEEVCTLDEFDVVQS